MLASSWSAVKVCHYFVGLSGTALASVSVSCRLRSGCMPVDLPGCGSFSGIAKDPPRWAFTFQSNEF